MASGGMSATDVLDVLESLRSAGCHPVTFDAAGDGIQLDVNGGRFRYPAACFVTGRIAGSIAPCLSAGQ